MRLKVNTFAGVWDAVNYNVLCMIIILPNLTLQMAFSMGTPLNWAVAVGCVLMGIFGVIINLVALGQSRRYGISVAGPLIGILGNVLLCTVQDEDYVGVFLVGAAILTMQQRPVTGESLVVSTKLAVGTLMMLSSWIIFVVGLFSMPTNLFSSISVSGYGLAITYLVAGIIYVMTRRRPQIDADVVCLIVLVCGSIVCRLIGSTTKLYYFYWAPSVIGLVFLTWHLASGPIVYNSRY